MIRTIQACEQAGIKTVFLTSEDDPTGNVPTMLEPIAEADAIVSTGFFKSELLGLGLLPPVDRIIGSTEKISGRLRDGLVPTAGPLEPPQRYDDHYGFNRLSSVEY
ncbi:MAG: hypothetical protein IIC85_08650 [Chloroflexi bacterium]|nr:hypothetical protein [Chloroflexota bacterium]